MSANGDIQDEAVLETEPPSVDAPSANESAHHDLVRLADSIASSVTTDPESSEDGEIENHQPALHRLLSRISEDKSPIGKAELISKLSKSLSEDKSQLSLRNADGKTVLHVATEHGLVDAAEWLIDAGADISLTDNDGRQPLHTACLEGHTEVAELLLKKGASAAATDNVGYQPLHMACFLGHSELARLLLRDGADIEARQHTDHAATPLYEAAWNGHVDVVDLLLKAGANTKSLTGTNWSSLHAASWNGHAEVVTLLLAADKSNMDAVEQNNNWTAINAAVYGGHADVVSILLEHGSTLATRDNDGWSPLLTAANKHPELIEMLLQRGRPNEELQLEVRSNRSKSTPLLATSLEGFVGGVSRLIDAGADLSAQDIDGDTALHRASGVRDDEWGFDDLTDEDRHDSKFIDLPADRHGSVVQLLLNAGAANLSARNKDGRTALYLAFKGYSDTQPPNETVMRILLKWSELEKADFGVDDLWKEAVEWAAGNSKTHDIAQLLFEKKLKASQPPAPINRNAIGWAAHERNTNVLALLISTSSQTGDISNALKSALRSLVPQSMKTLPDGPEGAQFFKVLWLLISASARDSEIENDIRNALNSVQKLNSQTQGPVQFETNKGKASYGAQQSEPKTKSNQSKYLQTIEDILREPPYPLMHQHNLQYRLPLPNAEAKDLLEKFEVSIVQFYKSETQSGTIRRYRQLKEVIYDKGPKEIMTTAVKEMVNITGGDSLFPGHSIGLETKPAFTWVHLPSTNINWMNDLLTRIMKDEDYRPRHYHEVNSFFRNSWGQVPDETSPSRFMRPRTVMKQYEDPKPAGLTKGVTCNSKDDENKSQEDNRCQKEESVEAETDGRFNTNWSDEEKHVSLPASAIYMPYLCFSPMDASLVKFKQEQQKHDELLNIYKDSAIHGSPTLDEWYYHFGPDSHIDKVHRNKDQVVSKFLEEVKTFNQDTKGTTPSDKNKKYSGDLSSSTFLRVNQLWVWTIANEWLITATSVVFDDEHDTLVEGILNQFRKQTASGGSSSQPKSVADMSKLVVDYCIGSYERQPKPVGLTSIGKVFSQYINQLGRQETSLFDEFRQQPQGWRQKEALSRISSYDEIREKAEELFRSIKGVRDELNILRSVAQYQKIVQRKLFNSKFKDADLSAETVLNDIKEMDVLAERIDLAVNATLSLTLLQQSEITNYQATLATAQGKTVRAFTFATVIFLPLTFFSSLFALDISSFQQTPAWAFSVIFFVSMTFSLVLGLVAFFWHKITEHLPRIRIFEDADLPRVPKDYHIAKPEKKEDPMSPVEPPTVISEGLYHRLRGHSKAKQQSHV